MKASTALPATDRPGTLLSAVRDPADLRSLPAGELPALADEIRAFLVEKVTAAGGHLGPNLGVVELTIALHRVFRSPAEPLLFDIGHQAYVHKLLTGRAEGFDRLRKRHGLSGYLQHRESPHDWIENSHASTALAYADGLAKAFALRGESDRRVVAVIGDGALTGGPAWEGLNNLGAARRPVVVVLNDNARSYAPTAGGLAAHLAKLREDDGGGAAENLFTALGLAYTGPVDGHDPAALEAALRQARAHPGPVLVHVVTVKGKGYGPAEADTAECMHAIGPRKPAGAGTAAGKSWTSVFGSALCGHAEERPDVVALTAAMPGPTGLAEFARRFPERVFDVGIAEPHAVTSAAGLAMGGSHPVVAVYSTFLSRAFDQVLMDVGLHGLPVTFVLDRAGITGPDGPSHHGVFDASLLSLVPGLRLAAPRDATRLRALLGEALGVDEGPTALRLPKAEVREDLPAVGRVGGADVLYRTRPPGDARVLLVAAGPTGHAAVEAARSLERHGVSCTVADPRWLKPVDPALLALTARHDVAVTVEDGLRTGGFGTLFGQACADAGTGTPHIALGLPGAYLPHGGRAELLAEAGLDSRGIAASVLTALRGDGIRYGHTNGNVVPVPPAGHRDDEGSAP